CLTLTVTDAADAAAGSRTADINEVMPILYPALIDGDRLVQKLCTLFRPARRSTGLESPRLLVWARSLRTMEAPAGSEHRTLRPSRKMGRPSRRRRAGGDNESRHHQRE